jgi:hypothetical protein
MFGYKKSLQLLLGTLVLFSILPAIAPPASAQKNDLVEFLNVTNPVKMDVLGLRLYMTAGEAAQTLHQKLGITVNSRDCTPGGSCVTIRAAQFAAKRKYVSAMVVEDHRLTLHLTFTESYPFDPARPEALTEISYTPQAESDADKQALTKLVREKYGPPAPVALAGNYWCSQGHKSGGFTDPAHSQADWCVGPLLFFDGSTVYLSDKDWLSRKLAELHGEKSDSDTSL